MKRSIITTLLIVIAATIFAQQDSKAKTVLDRFSNEFKASPSVSLNFAFELNNIEEDIKESFSGDLKTKGEMYTLKNDMMEIFSDGKTNYNYMVDVNEVTITTVDPEDEDIYNPISIFSISEKKLDCSYVKQSTEAGKLIDIIKLTPKDGEEMDYNSMLLKIDSKNSTLISAVIDGTDGNVYTIEVTDYDNSTVLDDAIFKFDDSKYTDLEIIDMQD